MKIVIIQLLPVLLQLKPSPITPQLRKSVSSGCYCGRAGKLKLPTEFTAIVNLETIMNNNQLKWVADHVLPGSSGTL